MMKARERHADIFGRESTGMLNSGSKTSKPHEKTDLLAFRRSPMTLLH